MRANVLNLDIDILNYLAIEALEKLGFAAPSEKQILLMEKLLSQSDLGIDENKYKLIA